MQLIQAFNAQQFDPSQGAGSLPIGRHPVVIASSEVKANKNNDGGYLQLDLKIIDGPQQGTTGAYRLNLYHSSQQTVEIAHRQFSAVCHVVGVYQVTDSSQLHNIPFIIEVGPQKNDATYTEVKKVFDINGNEPGKAGAGQAAAQPQQQPAQQQPQGNNAFGGQPAQGGAWGQQPAQNQQPAQEQPAQGGAAWGGQQQPAQNQQPAQQPQGQNAAWGQQPAQQQPAQNQAPANNGGGWQQQPNGGGQAAPGGAAPWGAR